MTESIKGMSLGIDAQFALQNAAQVKAEQGAMRSAKDGVKSGSALEQKRMEEAATQFEGLLLQQLFKSMWSSVPQEGMLSGSNEEGYYRDMLNEALAKDFSEGQGIGIKQVILNELKKSAYSKKD